MWRLHQHLSRVAHVALLVKLAAMNVEEIKKAIVALPPSDRLELAKWFKEFQASVWDIQIEEDAKAGKLDRIIEQAKAQHAAGLTKPL